MAQQQLQVNLSFTADAGKAKAQIENLQSSLNKLMTMKPPTGINTTTESILQAQKAAAQLAVSLKNATDVNTGKLNLTAFSQELDKSGMRLSDYRKQLSNLGPEGQKTFANLAKSVMTADSAIKNTNTLVNNLWISLKNTARWQLSSSMIKGFMGAISSAFNYAEDLNESLNKIQIVTGNSADQMARFAVQANKAAKELSTTTTAYTDASLIYYQQGLDEESVKARTDITIKAANAAGTNAAEMADYLTAVWNSYKVGNDELERYVDVMAALGAGTATSLEEISTSMEKVASVGEATGVTFEQMGSIIATVSSVTRQSAETVGTAFKTIFARMADLKLSGSVEEDGVTTDLGTVSKQLNQIGINILDANGDLRDMGDVMEELMGKWNGMNEATQQAVAIALAGKRQYTQLLALMNNQDLYQQSMDIAQGSEGTLEEQADTYAQSWEAAQKRVKAAAQGIYDSLINDKFFITMNNGVAGLLGLIEKLIDSMGGFSGVLGGIGTLVFTLFEDNINKSLEKTITSLYSTSALGKQAAQNLREEASAQLELMYQVQSSGNLNTYEKTDLTIQKERLKLEEQLAAQAKNMTQDEIELAQRALDTNKAYADRVLSSAKVQTELEKELALLREQTEYNIIDNTAFGQEEDVLKRFNIILEDYKQKVSSVGSIFKENLSKISLKEAGSKELINWMYDLQGVSDLGVEYIQNLGESIEKLDQDLAEGTITQEQYNKSLNKIKREIALCTDETKMSEAEFKRLVQALGATQKQADQWANTLPKLSKAEKENAENLKEFIASCESFTTSINTTKQTIQVFAQGLTGMFRGVSSLTMGISSLRSAWDTLNNPDMSGFEKFLSIMTSISMGVPMLMSGLSGLKKAFSDVGQGISAFISQSVSLTIVQAAKEQAIIAETVARQANASATTEEAAAEAAEAAVKEAATTAQEETIALTTEEVAVKKAKAFAEKEAAALESASLGQKLAYITATKLGIEVKAKEVVENTTATMTKIAETAATGGLTASQTALAAATALVNGQIGLFLTLIGPIVGVIAGVSAAVTGLVILFQAVKDNSPEKQLQDLTNATTEAKTAFDEASESVESLKTSLESLKEAHKNLEALTKGTTEYTEALLKANEQAGELMRTNKSLSLGASVDENGLINFSQESIEQAQKATGLHQAVAQSAYLSGQQDINAIQSQIKKQQFNDAFVRAPFKNQEDLLKGETGFGYGFNPEAVIEKLVNAYIEQGDAIFTDDGLAKLDINSETNRNLIKTNIELQNDVRDIASLERESNILRESQNANMAQLNNTLLGINNENYINSEKYGNISEEEKIKADAFDWHDRINYKSSNTEDWAFVQDFIKAQYGDDPRASYYAQQKGQMVISVAGEDNEKFSEEYVKNKVAEYRSSERYQKEIQEQVESDLITAIAGITIPEERGGQYFMSEERLEEINKVREKIFSQIMKLSDEEENALINNQDVLNFVTSNTTSGKDFNVSALKDLADMLDNGGTTEEVTKLGEALGISSDNMEHFIDLVQGSQSALADLSGISELITALKQGNELTDEQSSLVDTLKEKYPELANITDEYSKEFINNLVDIQQNLERIDIQDVIDKNKDIDIKVNIDADEAKEQANELAADIDNFLSNDLTIDLKIKNNIDSDISNMIDDVDNLKSAIESISDSWQVSVDDIDILVAAFPNILDNYSVLANGMIQLDGEVAQNAISTANKEVQANGNAAITKMEQERTFLQQKADAYNKIAEGLEILAQGEAASAGDTAKAKSQIEQGFTDIKSIEEEQRASNAANEGTSEEKTSTEVVNALEQDNQTMTQNAANAYGAMALASQQYADAAIQNAALVAEAMQKAAKGDTSGVGGTTSGSVTNSYSGTQATEKAALTSSYTKTENTEEKDIGKLVADALSGSTEAAAEGVKIYRQMAQTALDGIKAYDVGIAKMKALMQTSDYTSDNASTGGTAPKSSGGKGSGGSGSGGSGGKGSGGSGSGGSGGKGSGGSGSGGSGSEKERTPQHTDLEEYEDPLRIQDEVDRYQDLDMELTRQERILDRIKDSQDDLYGKDYFDALDKEKAALEDQNALLDKKNEKIREYNETDIKTLTDLGLTPEFDDQGNITNIEELQTQIVELKNQANREATDAKNAAHTRYDAAVNSSDESAKDALDEQHDAEIKAIEDAQKKREQSYDDAWNAIENYNDGINMLFENEMQKEENLRRQREINFEETMKALDIIGDLTQRQIRQIDNLRRRFREGLFGLADNTDADNAEIGALLNNLNKVGEQKAKLDEQFAKGEISESQYYEGLGDIDDQADELYNSIYDLSEAIGERFVEALDEADERMDESIGKFDHLKSIVSSIENLTKLTYGEENYDRMDTLYRDIVDITRNEYEYNKQMWEARKSEYEEAKRLYEESVATGKNQKVIDQLEENMRSVEESMNDWHERMYSSAEEFAEAIQNVYSNTINKTMSELEKQLTNGQGFDKLEQQLDRLRDYDDDYLTGVNQQYETQRLIRTAMQDMDKTDSKVAKNRLDGFIKETKELQKKSELSKFELGIKEREYQVLLAELALEEQKNTMSQVRLQRDSEGNFNYVYTTDDDAINSAQEEYEKAQNDLYNYVREEEAKMQEEYLQMLRDFAEQTREIAENMDIDEEERLRQMDELREYYTERGLQLTDLMNIGREASNQAYLDSYGLQVYDELATVDEMESVHEHATDTIMDANEELADNTKVYTGQMQIDIKNVATTLNTYAGEVEKDMQRTNDALSLVQGQTQIWADNMTGLLDLVADRYQNIANSCQYAMEVISGFMGDIDFSEMWINSTNWADANWSLANREYTTVHKIGGKGAFTPNSQGGLNESWTGESWDQAAIIQSSNDPEEVSLAVMRRLSKVQNSGSYYDGVDDTLGVLADAHGGVGSPMWNYVMERLHEMGVPGFDTGGYTGDFGPEARLGLLHEKELVLNQADTQNLLDSIELVDRLLNNLEYQNLIHDFNMVNWGQQVSGTGTLEQEVTIHAEFPNVQDRNEIELAITNLTNTAAQYANKRKR